MSVFMVIWLTLTLVFMGLLQLSMTRRQQRIRDQKNAFATAFREWSDSCDWVGYREIPASMYFDLVEKLAAAQQEKEE